MTMTLPPAVNANRSSDGMHTLSDVNLMKAMTLLNLMHLALADSTKTGQSSHCLFLEQYRLSQSFHNIKMSL